jgi:hypothetical protein
LRFRWGDLSPKHLPEAVQYRNYAVRGGRFLINQTVKEVATSPITLILNWKP